MKFILVVAFAFVAVAVALPHHKEGHEGTTCDYKCTDKESDKPICASNGSCIRNFPSDCQLEMYNCEAHPEKPFEVLEKDDKCTSLPQCVGDLESHSHSHSH